MATAHSSEVITAAAIISESRFLQWLKAAQPGNSLTYHLGNLALDREHNIKIDAVGTAVWGAHQSGKVQLSQSRVEPNVCAYVAIRKEQE